MRVVNRGVNALILQRRNQLALETLELLGRHLLVAGVDERTGRPRGIFQQRLVPARRRIVQIDGRRRRLDRRQAVVVIGRVMLLFSYFPPHEAAQPQKLARFGNAILRKEQYGGLIFEEVTISQSPNAIRSIKSKPYLELLQQSFRLPII